MSQRNRVLKRKVRYAKKKKEGGFVEGGGGILIFLTASLKKNNKIIKTNKNTKIKIFITIITPPFLLLIMLSKNILSF